MTHSDISQTIGDSSCRPNNHVVTFQGLGISQTDAAYKEEGTATCHSRTNMQNRPRYIDGM